MIWGFAKIRALRENLVEVHLRRAEWGLRSATDIVEVVEEFTRPFEGLVKTHTMKYQIARSLKGRVYYVFKHGILLNPRYYVFRSLREAREFVNS